MKTEFSFLGISRADLIRLTVVFFVWRIVLFLIGSIADYFLRYRPSFPYADTILVQYDLPRWIYSWANFDGVHYLTIAEKGYVGTGLIQAFFPMFPYVILRSLFLLTNGQLNVLAVGLLFTNLMALLCVIVWFGFLRSFLGSTKAWLGVALLLLFPTSLFLGALYTESLFFFAVIATFWAARQKNWWLVCILTILATSTRIVGAFLIPALYLELWQQWREGQDLKKQKSSFLTQLQEFGKRSWRKLLLISLGSAGLVAYMIYLEVVFHDPLYFLHVQSEFGAGRQENLILYPQVLWRSVKILMSLSIQSLRYYTSILEFIAGGLGLLGILWAARSFRLSYILFALGAFLLPTLTGTFSSMPRYLLVCFPLYLVLISESDRHPWVKWSIITIFGVLLFFNTVLFVQGYWLS